MLDKKLQLKDGQRITIIGNAPSLDIEAERAALTESDAVLLFVTREAEMVAAFATLRAASQNKLTWIAYPKSKQLSTDLNRDIIRKLANDNGLDPIRQVSIDEVWSALRLKLL